MDASIIGSGPNGLAAAIVLAKKGLSVTVFEAKETIGGGLRTTETTLPGFLHDVCSAIHPLAISSPFFQTLPLELKWIFPKASLAHPFDDGSVALLCSSIKMTAETLGLDCKAYSSLMEKVTKNWDNLLPDLLAPLHLPKHPLSLLRFATLALRSSLGLSQSHFRETTASSFLAGLSAHAMLPLEKPMTAAFGLILAAIGHRWGWPIAEGGSQKIAESLASYFQSLGGKIVVGRKVHSIDELTTRLILCDITPKQLIQIAGHRLPEKIKAKLRHFHYGPGVFKMDWALSEPIPWKAKECLQAGTVHLGGTADEINSSLQAAWKGEHSQKPFVILAQQSLFDKSRAPLGKHTAWGYCAVPSGSTFDMSNLIESQIERFAPGFRDCILARSYKTASALEEVNPNYVGGSINGGAVNFLQFFRRPLSYFSPYATPLPGLYLCSSSTPPGGGVHGMCGYFAAIAALKCLRI